MSNDSTPSPASSSTSPYAPPKAVVADTRAAHIARPPKATRAVRCLWAGLILSLVITLWMFGKSAGVENVGPAHDMRVATNAVMAVITAVFLALAVLINIKIAQGRGWARIVYLIINLMWLPALPMILFSVAVGMASVWEAVLNLISFALSMYTCYLLLTRESNEWFAAVKAA
jgi:hypothetical protein